MPIQTRLLHSRGPWRRRGLALRELLLIVAALMIVFGLVVSLARRVRAEAAFSLVERELLELEDALADHRATHGRLLEVPRLFPSGDATTRETAGQRPGIAEPHLLERAKVNNAAFVRALQIGLSRPAPEEEDAPRGDAALRRYLGEGSTQGGPEATSSLLFDGNRLLDPWGRPIVFMPVGRAEIGIAAGNAPFFFSAGPDGQYLTREDNVYSYEVLAGLEAPEQSEGAMQ